MKLPPYASVAVVEAGLDQLIPVEFRADLVLELRDDQDALVLAIVLELQREKDPRKKRSWPVYIATEHARTQCPTIVLMVAPDAVVTGYTSRRSMRKMSQEGGKEGKNFGLSSRSSRLPVHSR